MMYFDWTATTPISQNSLDEYCNSAKNYTGNPSSEHKLGAQASERLNKARSNVAAMLHCKPSDIYFTSGGTESDNIIIQSLLNNPTPGTIVTTAIEHSAVLENRTVLEKHGWTFRTINCPNGYLSEDKLLSSLDEKTRMVCIMKVNNVTGSILDTKNLVKAVREYQNKINRKIHIHCDAVQALGKIEFYPEEEDFDSAAFSAHKFYGPRGTGILYNRNSSVLALSKGGGQEKGLRGSTENLSGICAMEKALSDALESLPSNQAIVNSYRTKLTETLMGCGYRILSSLDKPCSPYILTFSSNPIPSQVYLRMMNDKGFCLSAGSACSNNSRGKAESVLTAMNVKPEDRMCSIRISLSHLNTEEEVNSLCSAIKDIHNGK